MRVLGAFCFCAKAPLGPLGCFFSLLFLATMWHNVGNLKDVLLQTPVSIPCPEIGLAIRRANRIFQL